MSDSLKDRVRLLEDREKIRELRANYCFLVDDGRFDELVERYFTKDAHCDFRARSGAMTPLVAKGRAEVHAFFSQLVPTMLSDMCHTVHNHRIEIEGDRAWGDCYFELTATERSSGEAVMGTGRYIDRYRRIGNAWLFEQRNAEIFHIAPYSEGWARQPFLASLTAGSPGE
jgi:ketosteroid isomerase-like protein